ncbi:sodium:proton antiporter NhaD [Sansalvadorimonas sp. 2012CJ34-2]|uniref:Sodium:proton antiporter NhaD n=1 Tax=Parendozoicomonas callyspongiae TaxID=2942213 RepID=A0ABT0PL56_9GAMM|nr:sodium:proton antiporter NhaD [Sansalvadorimonas sp. 2012CJ34-2]MCL6272119.1 sodium:proton antiporter NhaD [Sansalvadorimonas sp. 2012CJ34-2]
MRYILLLLAALMSGLVNASDVASLGLTSAPLSIACIAVFVVAYTAVIFEEKLHLRKSKPMLLSAGIIWVLIAILVENSGGDRHSIEQAVMFDLEEYAALLLFLLVAMTYVKALEERGVFQALRAWLVLQGFSFRALFWVTGALAFCISPIADNLTTALVMGAVIVAVGQKRKDFVVPAMVNVVVAANAGGAFSPFGDITTLMVWQADKIQFFDFFSLFLPSLVNWIVPAVLMTPFIPNAHPEPVSGHVRMSQGAIAMCGLFLITIALAVTFEQMFALPPFLGMMTGLSLLMFYTWIFRLRTGGYSEHQEVYVRKYGELDTFAKIAHAEWDTLFFFFGVMFAVGGLSYLGYLQLMSATMYGDVGPFITNVLVGIASAIIDNIPVMFAILDMSPEMSHFHWLLVTLTAGVGGSLLSVGSAAGVALMGQSRGTYTFMAHLRWSWAVAFGYFASIGVHMLVNG